MTVADFRVQDELADDVREAICRELREHNRATNPVFWAAVDRAETAASPLHVVAFDADRRVLGGLIAETRFAWLKISILAVRGDSRRLGIGRRLTALAEEEAVARGCLYSYVDTMDYQAPGFYQAMGYAVAGRLDDWDSHGHAKVFLVKRLVEDR